MSSVKTAPGSAPLVDSDSIYTPLAQVTVAGMSDSRVAGMLGLDYDTVRKYRKQLQAAWSAELEDAQGLRAFLFQLASRVYELAASDLAEGDVAKRNRPAFYREMRGAIGAMLDVTGLRTVHVDVGSSQFVAMMRAYADAMRASTTVEGVVKVLAEGEE